MLMNISIVILSVIVIPLTLGIGFSYNSNMLYLGIVAAIALSKLLTTTQKNNFT